MMVPIRSWSGGRQLKEECPNVTSSFDSYIQGGSTVYEQFDLTSLESDGSSVSSEFYEDDFTSEDEANALVDYSDDAVLETFHSMNGNQFESHDDSSTSTCYTMHSKMIKNNELENDNKNREFRCEIEEIGDEARVTFKANVQYRKWLSTIQQTTREKARIEMERLSKKKENQMKRKELLVQRARVRKEVGYDCVTEAARHARFQANTASEIIDVINNNDQGETRRRNKVRYKRYIERLIQAREIKLKEKEENRIRKECVQQNVTAKVMSDIQKRKDTTQERDKHEDETYTEIDEKKNKDHDRRAMNTIESNLNMVKLKERFTSELSLIISDRKKKEIEANNLKKRLKRRASILRKKYAQKTSNLKVWERMSQKYVIHNNELDKKHKESEEHNKDKTRIKKDNESKLVLTSTQVEALALRLYRKKEHHNDVTCEKYGHDTFDYWKQQNGLKLGQKVFCITGWYPSIRDELSRRGWFLNQDKESTHFDLKITLATSDIDFNSLRDDQLVNHFQRSRYLTTKAGIVHTLRNCPHQAKYASHMDDFFPRCYDLSTIFDVQNFLNDYHSLSASISLNRVIECWNSANMKTSTVNLGVLKTLLDVLQQFCYNTDDSFIDTNGVVKEQCFTSLQSKIILHADDWIHREIGKDYIENLGCLANEFKYMLTKQKIQQIQKGSKEMKKETKLMKQLSHLVEINHNYLNLIKETLRKYNLNRSQFTIDGKKSKNTWILKPAGKSRGRGIFVAQSLDDITLHILNESDSRNRLQQWVIQKYIENPFTISKRKFDIRQWVIVTDWNPLTIWFYNDCYIRFAVLQYDEISQEFPCEHEKKEWDRDKFRHLVNNSIVKKSKEFSQSFVVEETNDVVIDYMWSLDKFKKFLLTKTGKNLWMDSLSKRLKEIVIDTILCSQENMMTERKGSWEMYGFDIMIDESLHPWLLEVNSSPACDYSTAVTKAFVKKALPETMKVVLDGTSQGKIQKHALDTGGWECIYCGEVIPKVAIGFGVDIPVKGEKISTKRHQKNMYKQTKKNNKNCHMKDKYLIFDDSDLSDCDLNTTQKDNQDKHDANKENTCDNDRRNSFNNIHYGIKYQHIIRKREQKKANALKPTIPLKNITLDL